MKGLTLEPTLSDKFEKSTNDNKLEMIQKLFKGEGYPVPTPHSYSTYMETDAGMVILGVGPGRGDVIPHSIQLVAGRTGQEYNQRKDRKGAYWEDRYHATAVESGDHLARCMVYIDTNMVRAGVVSHPSMWSFCGYNEIQQPRRKNILINYERLQSLLGAASYDRLRTSHRLWIEDYLGDGAKNRQDEWTGSIAVGSRSFIENVRALLGLRARGREVKQGGAGYQLREDVAPYKALFGAEKDDIDPKNT